MQLRTASRRRVKIKCALQGPSSSGKTKSGLYIAYGLCGDWGKIAVIDTENCSSELYSELGAYKVLHLEPPFSPEKYIEALNICLQAGMEVVIIDSLTHEWEYILDTHGAMPGNSFTNWSKFTPRHSAFINAMLQANVHIIGTIRTKQDYVLSEKNGKQVPEKVGLKGVQRDGIDYEFTLVFDLNTNLMARASKDRTQLFFGNAEFIPTPETGRSILQWCNIGNMQLQAITEQDLMKSIENCSTVEELNALFSTYPQFQTSHQSAFTKRKHEINRTILANQQTNDNGTNSR